MNESKLNEALAEVFREMRKTQMPQSARVSMDSAVLAAYQRRSNRSWMTSPWMKRFAGAAIAATLALTIYWAARPAQVEAPVAISRPAAAPAPAMEVARAAPQVAPKPRRRTRVMVAQAPREPRREYATEFLPLPYAPSMMAQDPGQVVRVRLPRSSLRAVGLPVDEDRLFERVQADVLLGEDGIARAIRFVR